MQRLMTDAMNDGAVFPVVLESRKARHPVRRQQMKRVPALASPTLRHFPALEHDMLDAEIGQAAAHREPCLSTTDDYSVDTCHARLNVC